MAPVPSADELSSALAVILKDENTRTMSVRGIRNYLLQKKNWTVPERRLNKFVKRHRKSSLVDSDSVSIVTVEGRTKGRLLRSLFSSRKRDDPSDLESLETFVTSNVTSSNPSPEGRNGHGSSGKYSPEFDNYDDDDYMMTYNTMNNDNDGDKQTLPVAKEMTPNTVPKEGLLVDAPEVERKGDEMVFEDDNDGRKPGFWCSCDGCRIM